MTRLEQGPTVGIADWKHAPGSCYASGMHRAAISFALASIAIACRPTAPANGTVAPTGAPPSSEPSPTAPTTDPSLAILAEHGLAMAVPKGWTRTDGPHWVLVRDPAGSAGYLFYGWTQAQQGVDMLHLAEKEFGATMPTELGEMTAFPSGIKMSLKLASATGPGDTSLTVAWLVGASARPHAELAGTGVFAFWRADLDAESLQVVLDTINSIVPL